MAWQDNDGSSKTQPGLLENRSRSGVGITVTDPIPVGARVKFHGRGKERAGIVRYCRPGGLSFLVGIQLDEADGDWSAFGVGL